MTHNQMGQSEALVNRQAVPGHRGPAQPGEGNPPLGAGQRHPTAQLIPDIHSGGSVFYNPRAGHNSRMAGKLLGQGAEILGNWGAGVLWLGVGLVGGFALAYAWKRR